MTAPKWDHGYPKSESTLAMLTIATSPKEDPSVTYDWQKDNSTLTIDGKPVTKYRFSLPWERANALGLAPGTVLQITPIDANDPSARGSTEEYPIPAPPSGAEAGEGSAQRSDPQAVWDAAFSQQLLSGVVGLAVFILLLLFIGLVALGPRLDLAWTVALVLLALAALLGVMGSGLALLEFRGRARLTETSGARSIGGDWAAQTSEILKSWGGLGATSAILALAGIAIVCATTLGYRSLPEPSSPASSSASPSASAAASESPPPSASASPGSSGTNHA